MAMNGTALEAAIIAATQPLIKSELTAIFTIREGFGDDVLEKFATALANAIGQGVGPTVVSHIQNSAVVPLGIVVQVNTSTGSGATTGPGTVT